MPVPVLHVPRHGAPRRVTAAVGSVAVAVALDVAAPVRAQDRPVTVASDIRVFPAAAQQEKPGASNLFTGVATVRELFAAPDQTTLTARSVRFAPGARSNWHTHPAGQLLVITAGQGWAQEWGHPKQLFRAGDVVWIPAGVKHWHGATADSGMTHIAIQEKRDGASVRWLEPVTDAQYGTGHGTQQGAAPSSR